MADCSNLQGENADDKDYSIRTIVTVVSFVNLRQREGVMVRRVLLTLGFALCMCGAASVTHAQEPELAPPDAPRASEQPVDIKISPNTGMPTVETADESKFLPLADLALKSSAYIDPRYVLNSQYPDEPGIWERSREHGGEQIHRLIQDYKNFYLTENMLYVGVAVAIAAPLANTHADIGIRNWYQARVGNGRSRGLDQTASAFKQFGQYQFAIPAYLAFSMSGNLFPDSPIIGTVSEFGDRSLRALAVGAPMVGILQIGLGSDRPFADNSRWHPFQSNHGVSGQAFVGAVPFLTAASMTDSYALKALLVAGSFGPAWSRIHTDDHYFSQAFLGWSIAFLSVQSVNETECRFRIVPCDIPKGVGMGIEVHY